MFILLFLALKAITGDGLLSQNSFLVATVRLSSEKSRLDDVEESSLSKEFSEQFLSIHIMYGVKIRDIIMFLLGSV